MPIKLPIKSICKVALLLSALSLFASPAQASSTASAPYDGYMYTFWRIAEAPNAYLPETSIDGARLGIGKFSGPSDLFVASDGLLYVLDTGNGRIVVIDEQWNVVRQIQGFTNEGKEDSFSNPQGIFVTGQGHIYVADTDNGRVVELTPEGELVREIGAPQSEVIGGSFQFRPKKVALDQAGRIFIVSAGVFDGIIELGADGSFTGFMGTNLVKFNVWDYFWKRMATKEQRSALAQFVPIEFNNLDVDAEGFIYTTTGEAGSTDPVKRLNPTGVDVLRREGVYPPAGDLSPDPKESSVFIDVEVGEGGVYSVLDAKKGRVFTYDEDGNLMYIFGRLGELEGTFKTPAALERREDRFLVLDQGMNRISVFRPTRCGALINEAVALQNAGKYDEAESRWRELLKLDANHEIAYVGIGKALLRQGEIKQAMRYLKLGYDQKYYSKALGAYRKEIIREYLPLGLTAVLVIGAALAGWNFARKRRKGGVKAYVA